MAGAFIAVDLAQMPIPDAVEVLDYETILGEMVAEFLERYPAFTALVESDPVMKILQVAAYRELIRRQSINEDIKAVMIAHARGPDLEDMAARYELERLLLASGDPDAVPPVAPTYEDDTSLRRRLQLSFDGYRTAGPESAYVEFALGADADVLDAAAMTPARSEVMVAILSRVGSGVASAQLVANVDAVLSDNQIRPLADFVTVASAVVKPYAVVAVLSLLGGPDSSVVLNSAIEAVQEYADKAQRLGRAITISGINAALHQEGVQRVKLVSPTADILTAWNEAPYCTSINVTMGDIDG